MILQLLPRIAKGNQQTPESQVKHKSHSMLMQLPKEFDIDLVARRYPTSMQSLNTILQQELIRFNKLMAIIRSTLNNLVKAIDGLIVMSSELEDLFNKVFDNQVHDNWKKASSIKSSFI